MFCPFLAKFGEKVAFFAGFSANFCGGRLSLGIGERWAKKKKMGERWAPKNSAHFFFKEDGQLKKKRWAKSGLLNLKKMEFA